MLTDITELEDLKREKERLMEREMAVNSYAILAAMVRGISHDLSNLLSSIIGAASIGEAIHEPGDPDRQRYEAILNATERASAIAEELFQSADITENRAVPLDPVRELEETTEALRSVLPRSISLEVNLKGSCPGSSPTGPCCGRRSTTWPSDPRGLCRVRAGSSCGSKTCPTPPPIPDSRGSAGTSAAYTVSASAFPTEP